ncbi:MAG: NAD(P)-dependent oxidoreductase [Candidatus Bipolaricaulota bacterium]
MMPELPERITDEKQLDQVMSTPSPELIEAVARFGGGLLVLGVGGKMGYTLAHTARRAFDAAGIPDPVIGVSRFTRPGAREALEELGVDTMACDLLDRQAVKELPEVPNVVFMVGRKFGSAGAEALTWAMNAYLPGLVAERFPESRILVFSTGNVYPFVHADGPGADECTPPNPVGEYAMSCLGRERVFEHFSRTNSTPTLLIRLNYAIDLRYGVLVDIAQAVREGAPVDLSMPKVNVIWQGEACDMILRAFPLADTPPEILNVTGPHAWSVAELAERLGERLGRTPRFAGQPGEAALLADSSRACRLLGPPRVSMEQMVAWVADWIERGGRTLGKPTHFAQREGRF